MCDSSVDHEGTGWAVRDPLNNPQGQTDPLGLQFHFMRFANASV
jgi:hypothetical protein